jgi:hypothetical protein
MDFGLATALAAKIPSDRILNFMNVDELLNWALLDRSRRELPLLMPGGNEMESGG